jgi:hypothetical protein
LKKSVEEYTKDVVIPKLQPASLPKSQLLSFNFILVSETTDFDLSSESLSIPLSSPPIACAGHHKFQMKESIYLMELILTKLKKKEPLRWMAIGREFNKIFSLSLGYSVILYHVRRLTRSPFEYATQKMCRGTHVSLLRFIVSWK